MRRVGLQIGKRHEEWVRVLQNDLFSLANGEQGVVDFTRSSEARERESIGNSSPAQ